MKNEMNGGNEKREKYTCVCMCVLVCVREREGVKRVEKEMAIVFVQRDLLRRKKRDREKGNE